MSGAPNMPVGSSRQLVSQIRRLERGLRCGRWDADEMMRLEATLKVRAGWKVRTGEVRADGAAQAELSPRWLARVEALRRASALRMRRVPDGALDGLLQAVRSQVVRDVEDPSRAWARAGLSSSFLDAPQRLAVWRRSAVAALVLLGVGVGAFAMGVLRVGPDDGVARNAIVDPRDKLLEPDEFAGGTFARGTTPHPERPRATMTWSLQAPVRRAPVHLVGAGRRMLPTSTRDTGRAPRTVVFPLRDLSDAHVSDMLDGLAIPDIGSGLIESN